MAESVPWTFCQSNTVMLTYTHNHAPGILIWKCSCHRNEKQNPESFFSYDANLTSVITMELKFYFLCEGKQLCRSLFLIKLLACNFIKKRLQHRYFPVNIANFLGTPISKNICKQLLLIISSSSSWKSISAKCL